MLQRQLPVPCFLPHPYPDFPKAWRWLSPPPLREVNHILVERRFLSHVLHFLLLSPPLWVRNLFPYELGSWEWEHRLEERDLQRVLPWGCTQ